jgi:hypothetical protein
LLWRNLLIKSIFDALIGLKAEGNETLLVSHAQFERFTDEKNMNHVYFCLKIEITKMNDLFDAVIEKLH